MSKVICDWIKPMSTELSSSNLEERIVRAKEELNAIKATQQLKDDTRVFYEQTIDGPTQTVAYRSNNLTAIIIEATAPFPLVSIEAKLAEWNSGGTKVYPSRPWGNMLGLSGSFNGDSSAAYIFFGHEARYSGFIPEHKGLRVDGKDYRFDNPNLYFYFISENNYREDRNVQFQFEDIHVRSSLPFLIKVRQQGDITWI